MNYLPFENITYTTKLDPDEVLERLNGVTESKRTFRMTGIFGNPSYKSYEGSITGMTFNIRRIIGYRNSFLPNITGVIEKNFDGTTIKVKMRLHIFVVVFLSVWCGTIGFVSVIMLFSALRSLEFHEWSFIPLAMLLFAYLMTIAGFNYESNKTKKYMSKLFEAEIIEG